jgi:hypothetical protein
MSAIEVIRYTNTAPVHVSMHPVLLHIIVRTKMCLFEDEYSLFALC